MIAAVHALEPRKLVGGAAVLLLHLLVIAALLSTTRWTPQQIAEPKEIILRLIAPKADTKREVKKSPAAKPEITREPAPAFVPPPAFTPPATSPALSGLNHQLFGCTPDQLATATLEERAACASASLGPRYDPTATDYRDHTDRAHQAARWARERARKNAPALLPCMNPAAANPFYTLACLGKAAIDGKIDPDEQPGYADVEGPAPNLGDTRMAPVPH